MNLVAKHTPNQCESHTHRRTSSSASASKLSLLLYSASHSLFLSHSLTYTSRNTHQVMQSQSAALFFVSFLHATRFVSGLLSVSPVEWWVSSMLQLKSEWVNETLCRPRLHPSASWAVTSWCSSLNTSDYDLRCRDRLMMARDRKASLAEGAISVRDDEQPVKVCEEMLWDGIWWETSGQSSFVTVFSQNRTTTANPLEFLAEFLCFSRASCVTNKTRFARPSRVTFRSLV